MAKPPRGVRNFNPLNIRPLAGGAAWQGQVGVDRAGDPTGAGYCRFASWPWGLRAAAVLLRNYERLHGLTTLEGVIARWAPAADGNHVGAYVARVARLTGRTPAEGLNLEAAATVRPLLEAMARVENGFGDAEPLPWAEADMDQALELAGFALESQGRVRTTPPPRPADPVERAGWWATALGAAAAAAGEELLPVAEAGLPWLRQAALFLLSVGVLVTFLERLRAARGL